MGNVSEQSPPNWFDAGGHNYERYRLRYPSHLATDLSALVTSHERAVDVGCGNGQLTTLLAENFEHVIGIDSSVEQLSNARKHVGIDYILGSAESLAVESHTVDLITVAQAAHWFDLPRFYAEVRRVARPGAAVVLLCYGSPRLSSQPCDALLEDLRWRQVMPFWPPQTKHIDEHYRNIDFPFDELPLPPLAIRQQISRAGVLGYLSTWSAVRAIEQAGRLEIMHDFSRAFTDAWPDEGELLEVTWTLHFRAGRVAD